MFFPCQSKQYLAKLLIKENRKGSQTANCTTYCYRLELRNCNCNQSKCRAVNKIVSRAAADGPASCQPTAGAKENTFAYLLSADCARNLFLLIEWVKGSEGGRGCGLGQLG